MIIILETHKNITRQKVNTAQQLKRKFNPYENKTIRDVSKRASAYTKKPQTPCNHRIEQFFPIQHDLMIYPHLSMLTKCFDKQLNRTDVVNKQGKILFIELINELDDNRSFTCAQIKCIINNF